MNFLKLTPATHGLTRSNFDVFTCKTMISRRFNKFTVLLTTNIRNDKSSVDHLEDMFGRLSGKIYQKNRIYKNDLLKIIDNIAQNKYSTKSQGLLLIKCCTTLLPDEPTQSRIQLVQKVWDTLETHTEFTVDHYNELLRCYIDNDHPVVATKFLEEILPIKPNKLTFQLLLTSVCENGDMDQASEIITEMKMREMSITEDIFSLLIIGNGKCGKLDEINATLELMKTLNIQPSEDTYVALLRAYAWNGLFDSMSEQLQKCKTENCLFSEQQIMDIVTTLAVRGHDDHIPKILNYLSSGVRKSPSISTKMQSASTKLVYRGYPMAALYIYECLPLPSFGPKDDIGLHGRLLLRECVKASVSNGMILSIAKRLRSSGRNPIALEVVCEAALQYEKQQLALETMKEMKEARLPIRPHYFWPILLQVSKQFGEKHVFDTISEMLNLDVEPDYETLQNFIMPVVSFASPEILVKKFQFVGLTATNVITPMLVVLLSSGQSKSAKYLSQHYDVRFDVENLIQPLVQCYVQNQDIKDVVDLLTIVTERPKDENKSDWCGLCLWNIFTNKKIEMTFKEIERILQTFSKSRLTISKEMANNCCVKLRNLSSKHNVDELDNMLMGLVNADKVHFDRNSTSLLHPRDMDLQDLENHLIELEAKNMNTRGVLRKLLQGYCRKGDMKNAKRILTKCEMEGMKLSSGMKAMVIEMYIKMDNLEAAEKILNGLRQEDPHFVLDEYKIIDVATLISKTGDHKKAMEFIERQSKGRKIYGGKSVEVNCWRLLDVISNSGDSKATERTLNLISRLGYVQITNRLLGPLVKSHINKGNLIDAVAEFKRCVDKYRKTPLKHEIMCALLKMCEVNDSSDVSKKSYHALLSEICSLVSKVHGESNSQVILVAALAEMNLKGPLRKYLLSQNVNVNNDSLLTRCERFVTEKKLRPILLIADCTRGVKNIDRDEIYNIILKYYELDNDCDGALTLYQTIEESQDRPSEEFLKCLYSLLKSNKFSIPPDLKFHIENIEKENDAMGR